MFRGIPERRTYDLKLRTSQKMREGHPQPEKQEQKR